MSHPIGDALLVYFARRVLIRCVVGGVVLLGALWLAYQCGVIAGTGT